jgi:predicted RNase H-like nuclease (RuvC/YqgF family)
MWRARLNEDLTREEWRWFEVAMQEFKFQLMLDQKVSGSAAIDTAVREKINGRSLTDVMREGLQAHLRRKTAERDELEAAIAINAKRRIRPENTTMLQELAAHQETLRRKLPALNNELAAVQAELARLETKVR